jgi:steroid 5-alpha reductase family enzyme
MLAPELMTPVTVCAVVITICWMLSMIFREYSWVDRVWSIVPPVYVGIFAAQAHWHDARLNLMTVLTALWGARLTFNYARKGGYAPGGEDYRWSILRARMAPWQWQLFNLGFIAIYQNALLLAIALPAYTVAHHPSPLGMADGVAAMCFVALLVGETVADQQQWNFHQTKKTSAAAGIAETKGFLDRGMWAWSRHPNFFCEVGQWWVVYLFAVIASGQALHLTVLGPVLLTLLFHGSTTFTESISASKYPAYAEYQRRVSRILPMPPRG